MFTPPALVWGLQVCFMHGSIAVYSCTKQHNLYLAGVSTWASAARWGQCNPSVSDNCDVDKPCRIMGFTGKFLARHTRDARGTSVTQCHCLLDSGNGFPCDGNVGSCECELGPITVAPVQVTDPPFSVKGGSKTFNMCGYEICPCTDDLNYGPPTIKHSAQCAEDCRAQ